MDKFMEILIVIAMSITIGAVTYAIIDLIGPEREVETIDRYYITLTNAEEEKIGQIWANKSVLMMYGYNKRSVEIGAGDGVVINAGGGSVEIRQGNDTKIKTGQEGTNFREHHQFLL